MTSGINATAARRSPSGSHATRERVFRRRRRVALGLLAFAVLLLLWASGALFDGGGGATADRSGPAELPRGGRTLLPRHQVVAFYGAPQHEELGVLGIGEPEQAGKKLLAQARQYAGARKPVMPAFELISTIAHEAAGPDGLHRERQADAVIRRYLAEARKIKAILILDIQPGRADFVDEVRALEPYLSQPDVSVALDPEWSMPEGVAPGEQIGYTEAEVVNEVSAYLSRLVQLKDLPQKMLLVHQFTDGMVNDRPSVVERDGVAIVWNVDGFGTRELKEGVYRQLTEPGALPGGHAGRYTGFKLFFREDTGLMDPAAVMSLRPRPEVVVYE
jgi:hypothetical protein